MSDPEERVNEERREERRKDNKFDYKGAERRRAKRIGGVVVEYKIHGSKNTLRSAFLRNISSQGLSISIVEKFDVGTILDFNIYLTDVADPVIMETEVRWVITSEYFQETKREHYDVGLKFCTSDNKDLMLIREYIEKYKQDN